MNNLFPNIYGFLLINKTKGEFWYEVNFINYK